MAGDFLVTAADVPISNGESAASECAGKNEGWYIHRDIPIISGTSNELLSAATISLY